MMKTIVQLALLCLPFILLNEVNAQSTSTGQTPGGAFYQFSVPDGWQPANGLLIWNHGFDYSPLDPEPDLGPLAEIALADGMAVAASSYSLYGWAVFRTTQDLREMVAEFENQIGVPDRVYVAGGSMGGLVTAQIVEEGGIGNVVGAYPICGVTGGSQVWNSALDLRLLYDQICSDVPGAAIPGGPAGYSFALAPSTDTLNELVTATIGVAVQACTGIATPGFRTTGQQQRLDTLLATAQTTEQWLPINLAYSTLVLSDVTRNPDKLNGALGISNVGVDYGDAGINAEIERSTGDAVGRLKLAQSFSPSGQVGTTKIVALHTDQDGLVVVGNLSEYVSKVSAEQLTAAVVVEEDPTHCGFAEAEIAAGWQALLDWTDGGPQPTAASLQTDCQQIETDGTLNGPCRIDPDFALPSLADVVRERPPAEFSIDAGTSGIYFDPNRDGEGWLVEVLDDQRAVVYWFTYPPEGIPGSQIWMNGVGRIVGNQIEIDNLEITEGTRFGATFDHLNRDRWGRLVLSFDDCDAGAIHGSGPSGYDQQTFRLQRLASLGGASNCGNDIAEPSTVGLSGSWYDVSRNGEGWIVQMLDQDRVVVYWFTYDPEGRQAWVAGVGDLIDGRVTIDDMAMPNGTAFGDEFVSGDIEQTPWGQLIIEFTDCANAQLSFASSIPEYGSGDYDIIRLTAHQGAACAL